MTLRVTGLAGFGGRRRGADPIEIIQADSDVSTVGATTYNLTCDIGAAEAGRKVIVSIQSRDAAAPFTIPSVIVNGVSAAQRLALAASGADETRAEIWSADVPSGSGAVTVSVTHSSAVDECAVETLAVRNMQSHTPEFADSSALDASLDGTVASVTCPGGGIVTACAVGDNGATTTWLWTNLTQRYGASPAGMDYTSADDLQAAAFGPTDISVNMNSTGAGAMVVASFR